MRYRLANLESCDIDGMTLRIPPTAIPWRVPAIHASILGVDIVHEHVFSELFEIEGFDTIES